MDDITIQKATSHYVVTLKDNDSSNAVYTLKNNNMETIYSIIVFLIGIFLAVYIFSVFFQIMPVVAIILIIVAVGLIIYNATTN